VESESNLSHHLENAANTTDGVIASDVRGTLPALECSRVTYEAA